AGGEVGAGLGLGLGMMMPAMFGQPRPDTRKNGGPGEVRCQECDNLIAANARFCPFCGHQQILSQQCENCGKNLPPNALFCPRCGHRAEERPVEIICPHCRAINLPGALFCNQCGEKLA
ncbi:MAG: zinc-ribbon domain-containing protein, partial [Opitutae bacterium]|nr:zinc-ribbon domain-containing protein [Opitutae bacterium]